VVLQNVGYDFQSGKQTDLQSGLDDAAHQIDTNISQVQ
jgi:multiple sugar transport system substrate-binding protein